MSDFFIFGNEDTISFSSPQFCLQIPFFETLCLVHNERFKFPACVNLEQCRSSIAMVTAYAGNSIKGKKKSLLLSQLDHFQEYILLQSEKLKDNFYVRHHFAFVSIPVYLPFRINTLYMYTILFPSMTRIACTSGIEMTDERGPGEPNHSDVLHTETMALKTRQYSILFRIQRPE